MWNFLWHFFRGCRYRARLLRELFGIHPPAGYRDRSNDDVVIQLVNGFEIRSGWHDDYDPDAAAAGDWLLLLDRNGKEVAYLDSDEWMDPVKGRQKLSQFLVACAGLSSGSSGPPPKL